MKRWLLILLALTLLLMTGCDDTATPQPEPPVPETSHLADPKRAIEDCFVLTENQNGTYSYEIIARNGETMMEDYYIARPVTITVVNDDMLSVYGQNGDGVLDHWVVFCNVNSPQRYERIHNVVGVGETQVAFVEQRTDEYHLFVCDALNPSDIQDSVTMTGFVVEDGKQPDFDIAEDDGKLSITYPTKKGTKTVSIELK